ncbi:unnamed protein product [Gordionus sp. m RMFG-2023]|uniref:AT-rich interactive domain-containing protein 2-like isoform X3 n=1 Tax=Gordionus sp. m RMFG-2023 TaxID=3053472 RepID=UPI0030E17135
MENNYEEFNRKLKTFHQNKQTDLEYYPKIDGNKVDLYKLYNIVQCLGGVNKVLDFNKWTNVFETYGYPKSCLNGCFIMKQIYTRYLESYERVERGELTMDECDIETIPSKYQMNQYFKTVFPLQKNEQLLKIESPYSLTFKKLQLLLLSNLSNEINFALKFLHLLSENECAINEAQHNYNSNINPSNSLENSLFSFLNSQESKIFQNFILNSYKNICSTGQITSHFSLSLLNIGKNSKIIETILHILNPFIPRTFVKKGIDNQQIFAQVENDQEDSNINYWKKHVKKGICQKILLLGTSDDFDEAHVIFKSKDSRDENRNEKNWKEKLKLICDIFRNWSFVTANAMILANSLTLVKVLLLTIHCDIPEARSSAFDTLSNISKFLNLTKMAVSRFPVIVEVLVVTILHGIFSYDRFELIRSLEILGNICHDINLNILINKMGLDVCGRLVNLLTLYGDILILCRTLETLYQLTFYGKDSLSNHLVLVPRFIEILIDFLTYQSNNQPQPLIAQKPLSTRDILHMVMPIQTWPKMETVFKGDKFDNSIINSMSVRLKNLDPSSLIVISENPNTRILDPPTSFIINMSSLKICDKLSSHSLQHYNDSTSLVSSHCSPNNLMHFEAARFAERWFRAYYEESIDQITPRAEMLNCYYTYGRRYFKEEFRPLKYTSLCNCIKRAFPRARLDRKIRENGQLQVLCEGIKKRSNPLPLHQVPQLLPTEYQPHLMKKNIEEGTPKKFSPNPVTKTVSPSITYPSAGLDSSITQTLPPYLKIDNNNFDQLHSVDKLKLLHTDRKPKSPHLDKKTKLLHNEFYNGAYPLVYKPKLLNSIYVPCSHSHIDLLKRPQGRPKGSFGKKKRLILDTLKPLVKLELETFYDDSNFNCSQSSQKFMKILDTIPAAVTCLDCPLLQARLTFNNSRLRFGFKTNKIKPPTILNQPSLTYPAPPFVDSHKKLLNNAHINGSTNFGTRKMEFLSNLQENLLTNDQITDFRVKCMGENFDPEPMELDQEFVQPENIDIHIIGGDKKRHAGLIDHNTTSYSKEDRPTLIMIPTPITTDPLNIIISTSYSKTSTLSESMNGVVKSLASNLILIRKLGDKNFFITNGPQLGSPVDSEPTNKNFTRNIPYTNNSVYGETKGSNHFICHLFDKKNSLSTDTIYKICKGGVREKIPKIAEQILALQINENVKENFVLAKPESFYKLNQILELPSQPSENLEINPTEKLPAKEYNSFILPDKCDDEQMRIMFKGYKCGWNDCGKIFKSVQSIQSHVYFIHSSHDGYCSWPPCVGKIYRRKFSLANHLQDFHCVDKNLQIVSTYIPDIKKGNYKIQTQNPGPTSPKRITENELKVCQELNSKDLSHNINYMRTPNNFLNDYMNQCSHDMPDQAALQTIYRYFNAAISSQNISIQEDSLTKNVRLISALILRNIAKYSPVIGKRKIKIYETYISMLALSRTEASRTLAQTLWEINH